MSSAICFNLDLSKFLSAGNGFSLCTLTMLFMGLSFSETKGRTTNQPMAFRKLNNSILNSPQTQKKPWRLQKKIVKGYY